MALHRIRDTHSEPVVNLADLNTAAAVRERCGMVHRWVAQGRSAHFTLAESRLASVASYVVEVTRETYPDLEIPYHSRWRHFATGGVDRWGELAARSDADTRERSRRARICSGARQRAPASWSTIFSRRQASGGCQPRGS